MIEADADHDAEAEEGTRNRRPVLGRKVLEAGEAAVEAMGDEEARAVGDGDLVAVGLGRLVGNGEEDERARLGAVPVGLDRGDLGRLELVPPRARAESPTKSWSGASTTAMPSPIFSMVQAMVDVGAREQIARAGGDHDEGGREIGRDHHVGEADREGRGEDRRKPVGRIGDAVADDVAGRDTASTNWPK